jgi:hypothetical protein
VILCFATRYVFVFVSLSLSVSVSLLPFLEVLEWSLTEEVKLQDFFYPMGSVASSNVDVCEDSLSLSVTSFFFSLHYFCLTPTYFLVLFRERNWHFSFLWSDLTRFRSV